ncbi:unnamed protein product [Dicrocoelium dendriticum]|nr:unnamed protein product [Dicrocoelium dendriticum]
MPQLGVCKALGGFHLKRSFDIPEFRLLVAELVHDKTSAKYWHLKRDDSNKTFSIQFRTTPFNNTGVSHILEHTVLCGSGKYPVRDPFFKMLHRSQANFMNALTASDWTMYPFSTMNDADFRNLLSVYSDAVFNPKLTEFDFMQEGWRLEPEKLMEPSTKLLVKGVVFNEMKGVFSNALNRFGQTVQNNLLPRTYGYVSGGHPQCIPKLTWEELKQFHHSYYHPSNANIYSYGDVNLEWCLEYLNKEYLQNYTLLELENHVPLEPVWDAPRTVDLKCESDPMAPDPDRQCVVSLSYRLEDIRNIYTNFVLGLLSKLLLSGDNAPLYHGLIESGFALDWAGSVYGMDQEARTTSFHVGVQGVRADQVSEFSERVNTILQKVLSDGFPLERVEALLHQYELAMRHESARFGLHLIFALAHAVNHDADVKEVLEVQNMVRRFRADLQTNPSLLLDLMQRYLLDNKHVLLTTMRPDENWLVEESTRDAQLHECIVAGLSSSERDSWVAKSRELLMKQQQQEDISCLPCLRLLDISSDGRREPFTLTQVNGCPVQLNEAPTNGVFYFHALADLKNLSSDLLIYVPLFCELFPRLGAEELSYLEMDQAIELNTGGLSVSPHVTPAVHTDATHGPSTDDALLGVHLSGYCLEDKLPKFFELWTKLFRSPTWSDRQRLMTLILMSASGDWSANAMADSAHRFAMIRAAANLAPSCRLHELWNGLEQALLIKKVASCLGAEGSEAEAAVHELTQRMLAIWKHIADSKRLK